MSRDQTRAGRRTERTPSTPRTALLGLMVVGLTAAVLTLAGTTPRGIGAPVESFERVELEQRTFSCPGGIETTTAIHGSTTVGSTESVEVGEQPVRFDDEQDVALGAFAAQESRTPDWLAWSPCPEPRARWWFVGAGAAAVTHDTVLTVSNPRPGQAVLDIDVFGSKGPVEAPGLHGLTIAAGGSRVIDLAKVAPAVGDLAVRAVATRGLVAISAADRFAPGVVGRATQEWLPAQSAPSATSTLVGFPADPDSASLVVVNPRPVEAIVTVEVIGATGTFVPDDDLTLAVPPDSVAALPARSLFDGEPLAVRVKSTTRVSATLRTVTDGDVAFGTGVRPVRGPTAFAVPRGAGTLVLSSLGGAGEVSMTVRRADGELVDERSVAVPEAASVAVRVPRTARYLLLESARPDVVAGFSVTDAAGVAAAGVAPSIRSVLLPVVRPGW